MAFATSWLAESTLFPQFIQERPDANTGIIAVVPAFDEPSLSVLLDSLASCDPPGCGVELIIVINAPAGASPQCLENNMACVAGILQWKHRNSSCFMRVFYIDAGQPPVKGWGVGLARKTGMDEALRRFNTLNRPEGVIVSLDADCTVSRNYFRALYSEFFTIRERNACSISFEHPISGAEDPDDACRHIILYELHMRYFYRAMRYTGHPYVFHTIGSAIAFRASAYLKAGGMNRRRAGEDFYMIQKLFPMGGYFNLNSATVYPSSRISDRVPFGTGATISKMGKAGDGIFLTYNPSAFNGLKRLFRQTSDLFRADQKRLVDCYHSLDEGLRSFLPFEEFICKTGEINSNTSSPEAFIKRFFGWFNMFRMVRYLNHVHREMFYKIPVEEAASELLSITGSGTVSGNDPYDLLMAYRALEKGQ